MKKFEIGNIYFASSAYNHECLWTWRVIARTAATVTLLDDEGKVKKCRVIKKLSEYCGCETLRPCGNYSFCPLLRADERCLVAADTEIA